MIIHLAILPIAVKCLLQFHYYRSPLDTLAKFCSSYRSAQNQTELDNLDQKAKIMLSRTKVLRLFNYLSECSQVLTK